jgi:LysR family glycine cleavage system transcriptional activator
MSVLPPRPRGPSLNALRGFEAAARLGSFSAAAEELCVSAGAIAQHVKALEAWANAPLFIRKAQGVRLTPLGMHVIEDFKQAFDMLGAVVQKLRVSAMPNQIHIATLPSLAQLWLSPKLPLIREALRNISISVTAMETRPNMERDPFDLAIFFEDIPQDRLPKTGIETDKAKLIIAEDVIYPVCAPSLCGSLVKIDDLDMHVCLHDASWSEDWDYWLNAVAPQFNARPTGPVFSLYSLALEDVKNGGGVMIAHDLLVANDLAAGKLVVPFDMPVTLPRYLVLDVAPSMETNPLRDDLIALLLG